MIPSRLFRNPSALVLLGMVFVSGCATVRGTPPASIRIVSYNIQAGAGHIDSTAELLRGLNADVIGLQEVDVRWSERSQFRDQASELGDKLKMNVRFAYIYRTDDADPRKPAREYGVALLTRFPVESWRNDYLTRLSTQEPNAKPARMPGMADMVVTMQGARVRIFSTHLDYRPDPSVRATQVREILRYIEAAEMPVILMGDLNATPDAAELQPLFKVLTDSWRAGRGDGLTYPADKPVKRIDYVLLGGPWSLQRVQVLDSRVSDHRPVVVDVALRRK